MQGVIFDLDGTLADTLSSIAYFANLALAKSGLPEIPKEEYRYLVGNGAKRLVHGMLRSVGADTEENFARVAPLYNDGYDADALYLTKPYDGIVELLDRLRRHNVITAVLSNKPDRTTQKIVKALFGTRILYCRGQRDDTPRKPDPAGAYRLLEEMGIQPSDCTYVGDTKTDMLTGRAAGLYTLGVLWGFRDRMELEENGADRIVAHPSEIGDIILNERTELP